MRYLYIDQFRGFSDTIIPLKKVNFLVGENSTGKSSILSLIDLIHDFQFWFQQEFNNENYQLGGFRDIISASSKTKKKFTIGVLQREGECSQSNHQGHCSIITYKERSGIPYACKYSYVEHGYLIHLLNNKTGYSYKIEKVEDVVGSQIIDKDTFEKIIIQHHTPGKGFKVLNAGLSIPESGFLVHLPVVIETLIQKTRKKESSSMSFRIPSGGHNTTWFAPIRTKPRSTYDGYLRGYSSDGEHTPYLLKKRLSNKERAEKFSQSLTKIGKEGGLFESIEIKKYGREESSPFEVRVMLGDCSFKINSVGYGVSQALPIIVELLSATPEEIFLIQQPEVHLHPKAQAAFGELFSEVVSENNASIFVETHSDYTIDRYRIKHREREVPPESQILFFERIDGFNKVTSIPINSDGSISETQPDSYRDFFLKEEMEILGL